MEQNKINRNNIYIKRKKRLAVDIVLPERPQKKLICINGKRKKQIKEANHTEPLMPFQSNLQPV